VPSVLIADSGRDLVVCICLYSMCIYVHVFLFIYIYIYIYMWRSQTVAATCSQETLSDLLCVLKQSANRNFCVVLGWAGGVVAERL